MSAQESKHDEEKINGLLEEGLTPEELNQVNGGRVYRITNVRANATSLSGGSAAGATPVIPSISISGATGGV